MLTDTFHDRYASVTFWQSFGEVERRFLVQAYRIISDDLFPFFDSKGAKNASNEIVWKELDSRLSRELGYESLSPRWVGAYQQNSEQVCRNFMLAAIGLQKPDDYVKQRMSFIELAFREKAAVIEKDYSEPARKYAELLNSLGGGIRLPGTFDDGWQARKEGALKRFEESVGELNERLRTAGVQLNYHSGFIQRSPDSVVAKQIEVPFWRSLSDPKWNNVATDISESLDRRDTGGRDPAFYAAKALESTIKVISSEKGWTTGKERGAHGFIENMSAQRSGRFIDEWEAQSLKAYFTHVRNPLGHGPGNEEMPSLSETQTDWAIEFAMIWIKALVARSALAGG